MFYCYIFYALVRLDSYMSRFDFLIKNFRGGKIAEFKAGAVLMGVMVCWMFIFANAFEIMMGNHGPGMTPFWVFIFFVIGFTVFEYWVYDRYYKFYEKIFSSWLPKKKKTWNWFVAGFILGSFVLLSYLGDYVRK